MSRVTDCSDLLADYSYCYSYNYMFLPQVLLLLLFALSLSLLLVALLLLVLLSACDRALSFESRCAALLCSLVSVCGVSSGIGQCVRGVPDQRDKWT